MHSGNRACISAAVIAFRLVLVISVMQSAACTRPDETRQGRTIFVDAVTTATHPDGLSEDTAFPAIQQACDIVNAGDTIVVAPGVYFEHVRLSRAGTTEQPIVIRADRVAPGRVTITGANRAIREGRVRWELVDPELGLYAISHASLQQRPSRVLYSGTDLQPYPTLEELRRFTFSKPEGYPGPLHGFAWDDRERTLFVRLHASGRYGATDPSRHVIAIAPGNGTGSVGLGIAESAHFNFGIYSPGDQPAASNVVLDGLTFETPGVAGVFIGSTGGVTVRNCWCFGCRTMVSGRQFFNDAADYAATANHVTVENCEFTQYPAFDDMVEVIERGVPARDAASTDERSRQIYWWHRKGAPDGSMLGITNTYETGMASAVGRGWVFRENFIHDAFEGFSTWGLSTSRDTLIVDNRFERLVDNAVEAENHAADLVVRDNTIIDVFEPFSWQPLAGTPWPGPVSIHHNVVLTTPRFRGLWRDAGHGSGRGWFPAIFKIGAAPQNWSIDDNPWMRGVPRDAVASPPPGFRAWHNTVFAPGHRFVGRTGVAARYENFAFRNNLVVVDDFNGGDESFRDSGIVYDDNVVLFVAPRDDEGATLAAGAHGHVLSTLDEAGLRNPDHGDVSLSAASMARGATTPLPDLERSTHDAGALRADEVMPMQPVGPRTIH